MSGHVAVFDLDGTLTRRDTSLPFLRAAAGRWRVTFGVVAAVAWAVPDLVRAAVAEGPVKDDRVGSVYGRWEGFLHERVVARCLRGMTRHRLSEVASAFADDLVAHRLRPGARDGIEVHRAQGHRLVLASASLEVALAPLRRALGFDAVLGTRLEFREGVATGRFLGPPCWGLEKLRRVREVSEPWGNLTLHAYGDSRGDEPLLDFAHHAHRVR